MIVSDQTVIALATAAFPTFAVVIGVFVNNQRLNDVMRIMDARFTDVNRHIEDSKEIVRGEMIRMEQVFDDRLKHLEERLPG